MLKQPNDTPPVPTAEATLVAATNVVLESTNATYDVLESKATSLRRAATALLVFGMLCARPCPSSWGAWLAMVAGVTVLCASRGKLLCRSRFARFLSVFAAVFAGYTVVSIILSLRAGKPEEISDKVHSHCMGLPADTFTYMQHKIAEHKSFGKGLSFLSHHFADDKTSTPALLDVSAEMSKNASSYPTMLVGAVEHEKWVSQPEACDMAARFVKCFAKMMMAGSALAHLLLFFSAVAVVKRACRLRCAAYRAGLLTWKCGARCKSACNKRAEPVATVAPEPAAKEMA